MPTDESDELLRLNQQLLSTQNRLHQLELHLRHTQRLATIGTISSSVAHDFNNILCGILCLAELGLDAAPLDSSSHQLFQDIQTASIRATNLIRATLSFGNRQERPIGPISPAEAIRECLVLLRVTLPPFIQLSDTILTPSAAILGEITLFQQIVTNLVLNARHAIGNKNGQIEINLSLTSPAEPHYQQQSTLANTPHVCLQVIDDGCGIPPDHLPKIYDPFFSTKPPGQGTGLGLWITRSIVESWNGSIFVDSQVQKGTTFTLYFPTAPIS